MLLIHKKRKKPRKLEFNEAVLCRTPIGHPQIPVILKDIARKEAGYYGEQRLDTISEYLPDKDYHIFQGLRLANEKGFQFQIDDLILTPTYILIIEAKNMAGKLDFDQNCDQLVQNDEIGYEDPLLQAQFQLREFKNWLRKHQFPDLPMEYLVMMSNKNCVLKIKLGSEAQYRVCRGRSVIHRIEAFTKRYQTVKYTPEMMRKLCKLLLKKDIEPFYDLEKIYKISRSSLPTGVQCPSCKCFPMKYKRGLWHCPTCGCKSRDAHLKALRDYYLLIGPMITNQQLREFLHLNSPDIAQKKLKKLNLPSSGKNRHLVYQLSLEKLH
jgi:hypothetical protein